MNTNIDGAKAMAGLAIVLASLMPSAAMAEPLRQTFKDANGREVGRSVSDGRNTVFRDAMGGNTGRSVTHGNTTTTYDNMGRQTGKQERKQ